jgi:hypothetical protein
MLVELSEAELARFHHGLPVQAGLTSLEESSDVSILTQSRCQVLDFWEHGFASEHLVGRRAIVQYYYMRFLWVLWVDLGELESQAILCRRWECQ